MEKNYFKAYGIDTEYEFNTYRYVGKDYGTRKSANLGMLLNCKRFFRKNRNKDEKQYKFCDTYSDWEKHIQDVIPKDILNYRDMFHWLHMKKEENKANLESVKCILIPIYVALFSVCATVDFPDEISRNIFLIIISFFIIWVSAAALLEAMQKVRFYDDFIKVIEKMNLDEI